MAFNIAASQVLPQPVSAFFEGHALRLSEEAQAQRSALMNAQEQRAVAADTRAQEDHETNQEVAKIQLGKDKAKTVMTAADQVLALKGGQKEYVERTHPEFVAELEKNGADWSSMDDSHVAQFAKAIRDHAAAELGIEPQPIKPESPEGKIAYDVNNGLLTPEQGKQAMNPPKGPPGSYEEFMYAQKDPAFAKFLKDRKGKGLSMTLPDGTQISLGEVDPSAVTGPTANKLQETIVGASDQLDRLNNIGRGFDKQFLEVPGRFKGAKLKIKDMAGGLLGDMTPQEKEYLTAFATFRADAGKNLSLILNQLSGAAISPAEGERLKKGIPNEDDSPTEFKAKYKSAVKDASRAIMRANWALTAGVGAKSTEQLAKLMPLSSIDQVYEDRANEIWKEMGGDPKDKAKAIAQANQEFGLAR